MYKMSQADEDRYVAFRSAELLPEIARLTQELQQIEGLLMTANQVIEASSTWPILSSKTRKKLGQAMTQRTHLTGQRERLLDMYRKTTIGSVPLRETYRAMCSVPRVLGIRLEDRENGMHHIIDTLPLYGKSVDGTSWHRVGPFIITTNLTAASVSAIEFKNLDGTVNVNRDRANTAAVMFHGPSGIKADGRVSCYGTAKDPILEALAQKNDLDLVKLLVRYVECHGQHNFITCWPWVKVSDVPPWYIETFGP
jgi:hypothetical protein